MFALRPSGSDFRQNRTLLQQAVAFAKASSYSGSGAWLDQSGRGHDAQLGSSSGSDTNDPLFLTNATLGTHLYLPGVSGNYASTPDAAALDIASDLEIRCTFAQATFPAAADARLVAKFVTAGNQRSYVLYIQGGGANGLPHLQVSPDGSAQALGISTAVLPTTSDSKISLKGTWRKSDGRFQFFTSTDYNANADTGTWTQLGADVIDTAAAAGIFNSTSPLEIGSTNNGTAVLYNGRVFRAQVYNGIAGTKVFDADFTATASYDATRSTLTAVTGQAVTINRSATGRKTCVVDRPLFLLGVDDYFEVADHNDLDFAAGDSFTVAVALRKYGATANLAVIAKKQNFTTAAGYSIDTGTGGLAPRCMIADGTNTCNDVAPSFTAGAITSVALRRTVANTQIDGATNGVGSGSPTTDNTTTTLAQADVLRIGSVSGTAGSYLDGEVIAWALLRTPLSDADFLLLDEELKT